MTAFAAYYSLLVPFALLLTLSYDDDRVINNLGLDWLPQMCRNKRYLCHCLIASSVRYRTDGDFNGGCRDLGGRDLGANDKWHSEQTSTRRSYRYCRCDHQRAMDLFHDILEPAERVDLWHPRRMHRPKK